MVFKASRVEVGKLGMVSCLLLALLANLALAGVNEDLLEAIKHGDVPEAQRLLSQGADANAKTKDGKTALMIPTQFGHQEVRELLVKAGAN
jgi:ankyrin repeat protein